MTTKKQRIWIVIVIQTLVLLIVAHISHYKLSSDIYFIFIGIPGALYFTYMPYINNKTMFVANGGSLEASDDFDNWLRISYLFSGAILNAIIIFDLTAQIKGINIT